MIDHHSNIRSPKLGYYTVGSQSFESKIQACIAGTRTNQHPEWHFNDRVWQGQNWKQEPPGSIFDLYKSRAQQLREQYDWITISFSGGSDSHNIVLAFLHAGCHIDEIVTSWTRDVSADQIDKSDKFNAHNINHEYELAARPILEQIKIHSPKTLIHYQDVGNLILEKIRSYDRHGDWCDQSFEHFSPLLFGRFSYASHGVNKLQLDRGKKQAFVTGIDKPRVCRVNGKYVNFFLDSIINAIRTTLPDDDYTNLSHELFYWTPDFPDIVIKQAHLVMQWFKKNPRLEPILDWGDAYRDNRTLIESLTRAIIYPFWNMNTFQVKKPSISAYQEYDSWFYSGRDQKILDSWEAGVQRTIQKIDSKYLQFKNDVLDGFVGMHNGFFQLED